MNTFSKGIEEVIKLHYGQKIHRVVTAPMSNDPILKEHIVPNSLNYAAIETLEIAVIMPNESKTALLISGSLINKKGSPLYPDNIKKNFKDKIEIPFDQANVTVQPGSWFDKEKMAQAFAKTINISTRAAVKRIQESFEKFQVELEDFIDKGV